MKIFVFKACENKGNMSLLERKSTQSKAEAKGSGQPEPPTGQVALVAALTQTTAEGEVGRPLVAEVSVITIAGAAIAPWRPLVLPWHRPI